ncbi:MAG TPA: type IV secretion system DNA-binding domain-containing protein [Solirubrobacteraceae bacterium]|jgi:conjugal transfer pilus assembly protein TraD|nr:type IV secretion system DNA-binding domain-containing protein [Solirubrobacteraceae bacterium]
MQVFEDALRGLALGAILVVAGGWALARVLRRRGLRWTWASLGFPVGLLLWNIATLVAVALWGVCLLACMLGAHWHHLDLTYGADHAEAAHNRVGVLAAARRWSQQRAIERDGWVQDGRLVVGRDVQGMPVSIPVGYQSGSHSLVVGATGSGKTVSEAWIAGRLIEAGHGAVVIDPKGDRLLADELQAVAARTGKAFLEWTPEGPLAYNPYANGTDSEIADKALAGEEFTEPHYLRQAQRYLGHAVRVMHGAGVPVTPASLMAYMDPRELEVAARVLPERDATQAQVYLDSLGERQRRELSGVRDRLSILAESDVRDWLDPAGGHTVLDVHQAVSRRAVVYFRLDADRRPLLAAMIAAAIISDLVSLVARLQTRPLPTVVVIDEFSALAADEVARLFARGRSAGVSLILGTQELADLKNTGDGALREQTLGNVETVIAHRQNVPESAELIAAMAGTRPAWISTQQTDVGLIGTGPSGRGTRRRGYEFEVHPSHIKQLPTGQAIVITPGIGKPTTARINHPAEAPLWSSTDAHD